MGGNFFVFELMALYIVVVMYDFDYLGRINVFLVVINVKEVNIFFKFFWYVGLYWYYY